MTKCHEGAPIRGCQSKSENAKTAPASALASIRGRSAKNSDFTCRCDFALQPVQPMQTNPGLSFFASPDYDYGIMTIVLLEVLDEKNGCGFFQNKLSRSHG